MQIGREHASSMSPDAIWDGQRRNTVQGCKQANQTRSDRSSERAQASTWVERGGGRASRIRGGADLRAASGMGNVMLKRMRRWKAVSMASGLLVIKTTMPMCVSKWCSNTPACTKWFLIQQ